MVIGLTLYPFQACLTFTVTAKQTSKMTPLRELTKKHHKLEPRPPDSSTHVKCYSKRPLGDSMANWVRSGHIRITSLTSALSDSCRQRILFAFLNKT